jgi:AcrR family transcriptional regulator
MTAAVSSAPATGHASGRTKSLTSKGQRTRSVILDAAERQFAERGFDGVSLRQIMEEAGVQMGQVQYYFPAKEDVIVAVLERRLSEVTAAYRASVENLEARMKLEPIGLRAVIAAVLLVSRTWLASDDAGRHRYLRMLGLATMSFNQPDYVRSHGQAFRPLNERVIGMLLRLFPEQAPGRVLSAYHLIEANLLSVYVNLDALFARRGEERSDAAVHRYYDELEGFLYGGCLELLRDGSGCA